MKKKQIKKICKPYNIKYYTITEYMGCLNISKKDATEKDIIGIIFSNAGDLLHSRSECMYFIEYADPQQIQHICDLFDSVFGDDPHNCASDKYKVVV